MRKKRTKTKCHQQPKTLSNSLRKIVDGFGDRWVQNYKMLLNEVSDPDESTHEGTAEGTK